MSKLLPFLVLAFVALAATPSSAQVSASYQATLLSRPMPAECANLVPASPTQSDWDHCQVTRLYIADVKSGADQGRYPPLADATYAATKNELILLQSKQHQFVSS